MKKWIPPTVVFVAVLLDFMVLGSTGLRSAAPDCLVAVFVSLALAVGTPPMVITGIILGLAVDAVANPFIGGTALSLALASAVGGFFHGKFYADNVVVPGVLSAVFIFVRESGMYLICRIMGRNLTGFGGFLLAHILPSAVITALICAFTYFLIRKCKTEFTV